MNDNSPANAGPEKSEPTLCYVLATGLGLGYLKPAPGTWGSLLGVAISILFAWLEAHKMGAIFHIGGEIKFWTNGWVPGWPVLIADVIIAGIGVFIATKVARYSGQSDPQFVVIDEISGQLIALSNPFLLLNWKSWLAGFILFRVFDVWKPFPARQAESLPGGWGIMADDWIAGIFAGLVLWGVQALGVLR